MRSTGAGILRVGQIPQARMSPASPGTADRSPAQSRELLFFDDAEDVVDELVELWTSKAIGRRGENAVEVLPGTRRLLSMFVHKVL